MPPMKIMRRTGPSAEGGNGSGDPSKTTSDAGESGNDGERAGSSADGTPVKDRMILSREEKEVKYQKARERIFRDFPESKSLDSQGVDNSLSRSSSTNGRKKATRQRTPHDDTFEGRSQYNMYYPGVHHYSNGPVQYGVPTNDGSLPTQQPYVVGPSPSPASMTYVQNTSANVVYPSPVAMNAMPQYPMALPHQMTPSSSWMGGNIPQQPSFAGYAPISQPSSMIPHQTPHKSPVMKTYAIPNSSPYQPVPPNWGAPPYKGTFQQPTYRNQPPLHYPPFPPQPMSSSPTSYPYGQFPTQPMKAGMQNYSGFPPLAGNFNRSVFNPQTRSFVPGGRYPARGNQPGANPYFGAQGNMPPQWAHFGEAPNKAYESAPAMAGYNGDRTTSSTGRSGSLAKWGTPSHLPPKPPPSEVPSDFDIRHHGAPTHSYTATSLSTPKNGPLIVSGETGPSKAN